MTLSFKRKAFPLLLVNTGSSITSREDKNCVILKGNMLSISSWHYHQTLDNHYLENTWLNTGRLHLLHPFLWLHHHRAHRSSGSFCDRLFPHSPQWLLSYGRSCTPRTGWGSTGKHCTQLLTILPHKANAILCEKSNLSLQLPLCNSWGKFTPATSYPGRYFNHFFAILSLFHTDEFLNQCKELREGTGQFSPSSKSCPRSLVLLVC